MSTAASHFMLCTMRESKKKDGKDCEMQTFLPYADFAESAAVLDYRRLGKQRVEVKQLLLALGVPVGEHTPKQSSWTNHPAAKMWRGFENCLADYGACICREWRARGYSDTLLPQFEALASAPLPPSWLGNVEFHLSHQSNLKRKDPVFYSRFDVPPTLPYVWPVP